MTKGKINNVNGFNKNFATKSLKNINNNLSTKSNCIFQNLLLKDKTDLISLICYYHKYNKKSNLYLINK